jgi:hypothetical protein
MLFFGGGGMEGVRIFYLFTNLFGYGMCVYERDENEEYHSTNKVKGKFSLSLRDNNKQTGTKNTFFCYKDPINNQKKECS